MMDLSKARLIFFEEAEELCDALETALLDPIAYPPSTETYNLLFRTAHTIKGSGGIFGLEALVRFAHVVENVLERLRSNQLALSDELISLLLASNDHLRRLLLTSAGSEAMALVDLPEGIPLLESLYQYQDVQPTARSVSDIVAPPNEPFALSPLRQFSLRLYPDTFRFGFYPLSFLHDLNISGSTILGCGKPALVLDIPQLIQHAWRRERRFIRQHTDAAVLEKH